MQIFNFDRTKILQEAEDVRLEVRHFLQAEIDAGRFAPHRGSWSTFNPDFSRRVAKAGYIGITLPKIYGGRERSTLVRFVVTEEMLAAGAPCGAHWVADRQSAPQILRYGTTAAKALIIPRICAGECYFGIGMSEPDSGSDLAATRSKAVPVEGGWVINGQKIWTTIAHHAHYLLALVRTGEAGPDRHGGLTQFIIDMSAPGITVRPIHDLGGNHEFNEVFFTEHFVSDDFVVGEVGDGWSMVTRELAFERSGPDRFMSDYQLLAGLVDRVGRAPEMRAAVETGRLVAHMAALMTMSASVAALLDKGEIPNVEAALVKDVGTSFERDVPEVARRLVPVEASFDEGADTFTATLADVMLRAPSFTLRGGTREVLRGVIARGLGLR